MFLPAVEAPTSSGSGLANSLPQPPLTIAGNILNAMDDFNQCDQLVPFKLMLDRSEYFLTHFGFDYHLKYSH